MGQAPVLSEARSRIRPRVGCVSLSALVAAALTVSACGSDDGSSGSGTDKGSAGAAPELVATTPAPRGDLERAVWALNTGEPTTLDWIRSAPVQGEIPVSPVCETLVRLQPDFTTSAGLAEEVENPDPRTWIYRLRDGVRFHDGRPLTADDVVFSLLRATRSEQSTIAAAGLNVRSIRRTGPLEVTVTLTQPDVLWNQQMASRAGQVHEAAYVRQQGEAYGSPAGGLMCTGPYRLAKWEPGKGFTLTANDDYWDPQLRPKVASWELRFLTDTAALTNGLRSGEVDGAYALSPVSYPQLGDGQSGTLTFGPSPEVLSLAVARGDGPLADARIRRALSLAIDRQAIADTIYKGGAEPVRSILSPAMWGYAREVFRAAYDELPATEVDGEQARALVEEAGRPSAPIVIAAPATLPEFAETARAIQSFGEQIGLNVKTKLVSVTEFGALFADPRLREGIDGIVTESSVALAEPLDQALRVMVPGGARNYAGYDDREVTEALTRARQTGDEEERARLIARAQARFTADVGWIPIASVHQSVFQGDRITGAPASFAFIQYPWAADVGAR